MNRQMTPADREAVAREQFKLFRIASPEVDAAIARLEAVRTAFLRTTGMQQNPLFVMGPTQAGKSTLVTMWKEAIEARDEPARGPRVLHVTCSSNSSIRSLAIDILVKLGDLAPPMETIEDAARRKSRRRMRAGDMTGIESWVMYIALHACGLAGVEVVVLDEMHHMVMSDKAEWTRYSITEALKKVSIEGRVGLIGVGTERLASILQAPNTKQLTMRARAPLVMRPLNGALVAHATQFAQWVAALDAKLVEHCIFPVES